MLILTRKPGEEVVIGDDVVVKVLDRTSTHFRLGITAPKSVAVHRREIYDKIQQEKNNEVI
jgi:carbon storage regulator